jgi:16S rRNA (guanine527-N7)-methyltransferase
VSLSAEFLEGLHGLGWELSEDKLRRLEAYRDLIAAAAAEFNLTTVRDAAGIERRHLLESLALARRLVELGVLPASGSRRVIDIGSGAGLPGLPAKVALPGLEMALLESNRKRCTLLRRAIDALGLAAALVLEGRAEDLGHDPFLRESFDAALARAVAPLPVLLEYALPFLRPGGRLAATKGSAAAREVAASGRALRELAGEVERMEAFAPPGGQRQHLVVVRKTGPTPERYPRRPGLPAKRPLS